MHENGTVEQVVHYYPFGGTYADAGVNRSLQMYKYNGRELYGCPSCWPKDIKKQGLRNSPCRVLDHRDSNPEWQNQNL